MAQVFPLNPDESSLSEAQRALAATLAGLPTDWTLLRDRRFSDAPADSVLVHPAIGIALVALAPHDAAAPAALLREQLERERFAEFFQGELPIVALTLSGDEIPEIGERLAAAFEAVPPLDIADKDWADGVIELLLVPSDVSMIPTGGMDALAAEQDASSAAELPAALMAGETLAEPVERPRYQEAIPAPPQYDASGDDVSALRADTPAVFALGPLRRRRWLPAAAAAVIVLAVGLTAWSLDDTDSEIVPRASSPQALVDVPPGPPAGTATATAQEPPAVPPGPPVVMATKPLAAPPPPAPHRTQVAALPPSKPPVVMAEKPRAAPPPEPPRPTAVAALPAPKPPVEMTQKTAAAPPPAAPRPTAVAPLPAAPPQQVREAAAAPAAAQAKPRRPQAERPRVSRSEAAEATQQLMQREIEARRDRPPIDAADLPPLEATAPTPPAAPQQAGAAPLGSTIGPPVQLVRSPSAPPSALSGATAAPVPAAATVPAPAAAAQRECRPYTSDTTLSGRSLRVEGIACRGPDGQWRLVSEAPAR